MIDNRNGAWRCLTLLFLLLSVASAAVATVDRERRDVIATGDPVPGFGRIGTASFEVLGIDRRGRILVGSELTSGEEILLFADGRKITTLWRTGEPANDPLRLDIQSGALSPAGRVVAAAVRQTDSSGLSVETSAVVAIDGERLQTIAALGDSAPDGGVICSLGRRSRINDAGDVAFEARVAESLAACDSFDSWGAIHVRRGGITRVEASTRGSIEEQELRLIENSADGSVVFIVSPDLGDAPEAVLVSRDGASRCVIDAADGCSGKYGRAIGASPSGEVLLQDLDDGVERVYRTDGGALRQVAATGDVLPGGHVILSFDQIGYLNDDGDAALHVQWDEGGLGNAGAVLFPAAGTPQIILANHAVARGLNDSKQIALLSSDPPPDRVSRRSGGAIEPILATGDAVSGGAVFAVYGLFGSACLADDGRVAAIATGADYGQGIVCRDSKGPHLIARHDRPAPGGGSFVNFFYCAFADGPRLFFLASIEDAAVSLYSADADGLERVIGRGDVIAGGTVVGDIDHLSPFSVSADGTVVLQRSEFEQLLRRRPDGTLERVVLHPGSGQQVLRIESFGIADGGAVVASVELSSPRESALVVENAGRGRVVVTATDEALPGGPFARLGSVLVSGQQVVFEALDTDDHSSVFGYDLQTGTVSALLPRDPSGVFPRFLLDLTPSGDLLFSESVENHGEHVWPTATYLLAGGEIRFLFHRMSLADSEPFAINDQGNVLFRADRSPLGADRHSLSLAGPDPNVACPAALEPEVDEQPRSGGDGCQLDGSPEDLSSFWFCLLAMAFCGLWRNRILGARTGR
jgi:hypothetical protein